ncbi:PrsW family glutamic-type intramembrane protease [Actinoplanes sp. NPDC023936]|uniref:PrsW family glutamic-type intramembrane protease n=1 Tax=Actinoplanes sp. NPDC023936 TaxID=3154910 RepID=UPI003400EE32
MVAPPVHHSVAIGKRTWFTVLVAGMFIWLLAAGVTAVVDDAILTPTLFLVGSFLIPVTVVTFALGRLDDCRIGLDVVLKGFLIAGTVGVLVSAVTEIYLLPTGSGPLGNAVGFFGVGVIEELSKGAVLVAVAWPLRERTVRGGMVLGAVVGAGFAAFESAGYAFWTYVQHADDHPELNILQVEVSRAMLAPFGHLTWTALLGGALFAAAAPRNGGFRLTMRVGWTLLGIVTIHGIWDACYGWAIWLTQGLVGNGWVADWPDGYYWESTPTRNELWIFQAFYSTTQIILSIIGLVWVVLSWRHGGRRSATDDDEAETTTTPPGRR